MTSFVQKILVQIVTNLRKHKTHEKDVVGIVTLNLTGMTTNHIIILQWHILKL